MELTLETLQAEVLKLPAADRVRLLDVLLDSIDEDDEVEREWERVADERDAELESGTASPVDGPSVLARLRTKYGA
ncbi:MAG TPA: addiction module protein [Burkholderiaceae bacterium]|nr:addiction module protein [Burkholderiaceae bacterium]